MIVRAYDETDPIPDWHDDSSIGDPLGPARGILLGSLIGAAFWIGIGLLLWWLLA